MAVPWALVFATAAAVAGVGIPLVYVLSRALKLAPRPVALENPRREALAAVLVVVAAYAIFIAANLTRPETTPSWTDPGIIILYAVVYAALLAAVFIAARATRQAWASVGLSRQALPRMVVLGLVTSAIYVPVVGLFNFNPEAGFPGAVALAIGFAVMTIVGFVEETLFRGYVQTRFEGAFGTWAGYALTVVVFTFVHFPGSYVVFSGNVLDALLSTLGRVGGALLLGYFYIRSRNVVPGAIFHLFANWAIILWQVPQA